MRKMDSHTRAQDSHSSFHQKQGSSDDDSLKNENQSSHQTLCKEATKCISQNVRLLYCSMIRIKLLVASSATGESKYLSISHNNRPCFTHSVRVINKVGTLLPCSLTGESQIFPSAKLLKGKFPFFSIRVWDIV